MRSPSGWAVGMFRGLAPGGDQHDVGVVLAGGAVGGGRLDAVMGQSGRGVAQLAPRGDQLHTHAEQLGGDVGRLLGGQPS